jgi:hypothetical protein
MVYFKRSFALCVCSLMLGACASPDHIVGQSVKDWCKRDVHCGRQNSDPSQVPTGSSPSRDNPSGAPR